jgi:hypothetical protein
MDGWIVSHAFLSLQPIILSADSSSAAAAAEKKTMKKRVMCSFHIIEGMLTYPTTLTGKQNKENYMEAPRTSKATELPTETKNFVIIIRSVEYCRVPLQGTLDS